MLEIDYSRIPAHWLKANNPELRDDKLRADLTPPGRYIYTVNRDRDRAFVILNLLFLMAFLHQTTTSGLLVYEYH